MRFQITVGSDKDCNIICKDILLNFYSIEKHERRYCNYFSRAKKSLVKGFLSSDIASLDPNNRMQMAAALCEQSDWPEKTVSNAK